MAGWLGCRRPTSFFMLVVLLMAYGIQTQESPEMQADIQFPPVIEAGNGDIPTGHLKPFGHQRAPDSKIVEYDTFIHPKEFWEKYVDKSEPMVLRGGAGRSPANQKWTDEYLDEKYNNLHVIIERKVERRPQIKLRMTLRHFLQNYKKENWYIVSLLPNEMRHEVQAPVCLFCGNFQHNLQELNFWMSNGGTASIIHYDADHNIHCLLEGRKDFIMIHPYYNKYLDLYKPPSAGSGFTSINVDSVDLIQFPELSNVQWTWTTLHPGDCIFIPSKYIHQVRSYGRSISVTTLFTTHDVYNETDCHNFTFSYASLADMDIMWTYQEGDETIDIGYGDIYLLKKLFLHLVQEEDDGKMTKEMFEHDAYDMIRRIHEIDTPVDKVWPLLDDQGKGYITTEDIQAMDREKLKTFSRLTTAPAGPLHEFVISEEEMAILLKIEEEEEEKLERQEEEIDLLENLFDRKHEEL